MGKLDNGYFVCTNLHGPSLQNLYDFCGKQFSLNTSLQIALKLIDLLEILHSTGHIHNDIKPDNIVINVDDAS